MSDQFLAGINQKFSRWYAEQPEDVLSSIRSKWGETENHPERSPQHDDTYLRQTILLRFCADVYGYDFT